MPDEQKPSRSWQEIVYDASRERDPDRQKQLREELEVVLEERAKKLPFQPVQKVQRKVA